MQVSYLVNDGNIKKTFPPKLVCKKNNFCKIQGMPHVNTVDTCMQ